MRTRLTVTTLTCALLGWTGSDALAQSSDSDSGQDAGPTVNIINSSPAVGVNSGRPLRTIAGQPVRVNGGVEGDRLSVGIMRPFQSAVPYVGLDPRNNRSWTNRFDRSDRWLIREVQMGRMVLPAYPDPYSYLAPERSIGVVRAFRTFNPAVRNSPQTVTNPLAGDEAAADENANADTVGPRFGNLAQAGDATVYAMRPVESLDAALRDDPWALLDAGYYREALAKWTDVNTGNATVRNTGRALAAAMSGDLDTARDLMPDQPRLPDGLTLSASTERRISQTAEFLFADDAAMQQALQNVLSAGNKTNGPTAN